MLRQAGTLTSRSCCLVAAAGATLAAAAASAGWAKAPDHAIPVAAADADCNAMLPSWRREIGRAEDPSHGSLRSAAAVAARGRSPSSRQLHVASPLAADAQRLRRSLRGSRPAWVRGRGHRAREGTRGG
jgi:hypothetical protein